MNQSNTDSKNKKGKTVMDIFSEADEKKKQKKQISSIADLYGDLEYSQQYGNNIFVVILMMLLLLMFYFYMNSKANSKKTVDNWPMERCKPQNIFMAGFINKPFDKTATEYTAENFSYCVNNVLKNIVGNFLQPFNYIAQLIVLSFDSIVQGINDMRKLMDTIREELLAMLNQIFSMIVNFIIPLQQVIISMKDMLAKTQGILLTGMFSMLCIFYAAIDVVGALITLCVMIIITLIALLIFTFPLTFIFIVQIFAIPAYASMYITFVIISVALLIVIVICAKLQEAYPAFCFDEATRIELADGSAIPIATLSVGQHLKNKSYVTAIMKMDARGVKMYDLNGVIVGGAHYVQYKDKWRQVEKHPSAKYIGGGYEKPFIYCLNTSNKEVVVEDTVFSDWDDLFLSQDMTKVLKCIGKRGIENPRKEDIHVYIDGGFAGDTLIKMHDGSMKRMADVEPGDFLYRCVKVGGVVKLDGTTVDKQYMFDLGNCTIQGGPHLVYEKNAKSYSGPFSTLCLDDSLKKTMPKEDVLYHLITDSQRFMVGDIDFYDYNSIVEFHAYYYD